MNELKTVKTISIIILTLCVISILSFTAGVLYMKSFQTDDINHDGKVNYLDVSLFGSHYKN